MNCLQITVVGRVQGVFFRKYTQDKARELGLTGYVRNQPDGSVRIVACGQETVLEDLVRWCHAGSPMASVSEVQVKSLPMEESSFSGFEVRY